MVEKTASPLVLDEVDALLKRVSSNYEKHGDEHVPVLDIACETEVPCEVLEPLLGKYFERSLFESKKGVQQPAAWLVGNVDLPLPYIHLLQTTAVTFVLSDDVSREFGEEPNEGEEATSKQQCPISKITFEPRVGGVMRLSFSVRIRPKTKHEVWAFMQHHQRHAKLSISNSSIKRTEKQAELPLVPPVDAPEVSAEDAAEASKANVAKTVVDDTREFAEKSKAQVEAFTKSRRSGNVIDGRSRTN